VSRARFVVFLVAEFLFFIPAAPASAQEFSFFESGMFSFAVPFGKLF
jgi:hypothetical protein